MCEAFSSLVIAFLKVFEAKLSVKISKMNSEIKENTSTKSPSYPTIGFQVDAYSTKEQEEDYEDD